MVVETARLILREFVLSDAKDLLALNADPEVLRYTGDAPFRDQKEAEEFLLHYNHYEMYQYGRWAVINKVSNEFLGWCGIKYHPETNEVDLGFRFKKQFWGMGYAFESAEGVIKYGANILKLKRLIARVETRNVASIKLIEKLGFTLVQNIEFNGVEGKLFEIYLPIYSDS